MQKYFVLPDKVHDHTCYLSGSDLHHIRDVLRYHTGHQVIIGISGGKSYLGVIGLITRDICEVTLTEELNIIEPYYNVTIAQALIKKDRFELFLEKAAELGVSAVIPTVFSRSVVKIDETKESRKHERFQLILKEASEQSKRKDIPELLPFTILTDIDYPAYDRVIVCYEKNDTDGSLKEIIGQIRPEEKILVIVGPEGGISKEEAEFLSLQKAFFVTLGNRILRSETASIMVLSAFLYEGGR